MSDEKEKDFLKESTEILDMLGDYENNSKEDDLEKIFKSCDGVEEFAYYIGLILYKNGLDEESVMTFLKKTKKEWKKNSIGEEDILDSEEEKDNKEKDKSDNRKTAYYGFGGAEGGRKDQSGDLQRFNPEKRRGVKYENL